MAYQFGTADNYIDLYDQLIRFLTGAGDVNNIAFSGTGDGVLQKAETVTGSVDETWTLSILAGGKTGVADWGAEVSALTPLLHWRFEEAQYDLSIADEAANVVAGVYLDRIASTAAQGATSNLSVDASQALQLDAHSYVDTNRDVTNKLLGNATMLLAIQWDGAVPTPEDAFIGVAGDDTSDNSAENHLFCLRLRYTGAVEIFHESGGGSNTLIDISGVFTPVPGTKYHVIITRDCLLQKYYVYIDGVLVANYDFTSNPTNGENAQLRIGGWLNATIDEFVIFNHKLEAADALALYDGAWGASPVADYRALVKQYYPLIFLTMDSDATFIDQGPIPFTYTGSAVTLAGSLKTTDTNPSLKFVSTAGAYGSYIASSGNYFNDTQLSSLGDQTTVLILTPDVDKQTCPLFSFRSSTGGNTLFQAALNLGYITLHHQYHTQVDVNTSIETHVRLEAGVTYCLAFVRNVTQQTIEVYVDGTLVWTWHYQYLADEPDSIYLALGVESDYDNFSLSKPNRLQAKIDELAVFPSALTQVQLFDLAKKSIGHENYTVTGSVTGVQSNGVVGLYYEEGPIRLRIQDGATNFSSGDNFTFDTLAGAIPANQEWEIEQQEAFAISLRGPGLSGTDNIFVQLRTYEDPDLDYYNWAISGADAFDPFYPREDQVLRSAESFISLWNTAIPYWFWGDGRYFYMVAKIGITYHDLFGGLGYPFATPDQFPYPLVIHGSSGAEAFRYSENSGYTSSSAGIGVLANPAPGTTRMRDQSASWREVSNDYSTTYDRANKDYIMFPFMSTYTGGWSFLPSRLREDANGCYPIDPCILLNSGRADTTRRGVLMVMPELYQVSGFANAPENIVEIGADQYIVFPNIYRVDIGDYFCVKLQ